MKMRSALLVMTGLAGSMWMTPGRADAGVSVTVTLPRLIIVAGTEVRYCDDCDEDVFFHRNIWYVYRSGGWYRRSAWGDSWTFVRLGRLPDVFMRVPPGRFKHRFRDWHPAHEHHPKLDRWERRSHGRAGGGRDSGRTVDRDRGGDRRSDRNQRIENEKNEKNDKKDKKDKQKDKKGKNKGAKGGHGRN